MLLLATLAALAADPAPRAEPVVAELQARAFVRILRPAHIRLGEGADGADQEPVRRETEMRDRDGTQKPAILIEFT